MPLVKKSSIRSALKKPAQTNERPHEQPLATVQPSVAPSRTKIQGTGQRGTAAERIGAASLELASGIAEAASAAGELQRAMQQISSGAEEAAGAAQESLGLIKVMTEGFGSARERAEESKRQAEQLHSGFTDTNAQIKSSVAAIELNAERQLGSVSITEALETRTTEIAATSREVSEISERTSLLSLNAALEAARAGDHGRGFSIVADEVRALAEGSETNAKQVQSLTAEIASSVRSVAERIRAASAAAAAESAAAQTVAAKLDAARSDIANLSESAQQILLGAIEADAAAREAQRGAEQVASAAEEQSAAVAEAQQAVQQQNTSLEQSHQAAEELSKMAERLDGANAGSVAEQVAASAEELSATVQELSGAANEILVAVEQIGRGAELQAAATLEADTAMGQIEKVAALAKDRARAAVDRVKTLQVLVGDGQETIERLAKGVTNSLQDTRAVLTLLTELGEKIRRIEKIVNGVALVAVQINMLAVSGSIESTRAGDAGAGFATVSSDIRKLSQSAAENAERGIDTVRAMQDQLTDLRRELDQIAATSESELARHLTLAARLEAMVADLAAAQAASDAIASITDVIVASAAEIRRGTANIASAAEEASAASRQSASAAQQQSQAAEQLAAAVEEIASLSSVLTAGKA